EGAGGPVEHGLPVALRVPVVVGDEDLPEGAGGGPQVALGVVLSGREQGEGGGGHGEDHGYADGDDEGPAPRRARGGSGLGGLGRGGSGVGHGHGLAAAGLGPARPADGQRRHDGHDGRGEAGG